MLGDPLAGFDRSGQRHHRHVIVLDQRRARVVAAEDHVEHPRGEDLGGQLSEPDGRCRGRRSRLEHGRAAGGQRRADLPDRHHQRVVPGRDLPDDPDRLAADDRRVALEVLAGRLALQAAGGAGEEPQRVDDRRDLVGLDRLDRLARVLGLDRRDLIAVLLDRVGQLQQRQRTVGRRGAAPGLKCLRRGLDRTVDVGGVGTGGLADLLAGRRVDHRVGRAGLRGDELAVDEVLQIADGYGHESLSCRSPALIARPRPGEPIIVRPGTSSRTRH